MYPFEIILQGLFLFFKLYVVLLVSTLVSDPLD